MPVPKIESLCQERMGMPLKQYLINCRDSGVGLIQIGKSLDVGGSGIWRWIVKYGIEWPNSRERNSARHRRIRYRGVMDSKEGHCKRLGVSLHCVYQLQRRHEIARWVDALDLYVAKKAKPQRITFEWRGQVLTMREHCERYGLNRGTVTATGSHYGIGWAEALELVLQRRMDREQKTKNRESETCSA